MLKLPWEVAHLCTTRIELKHLGINSDDKPHLTGIWAIQCGPFKRCDLTAKSGAVEECASGL